MTAYGKDNDSTLPYGHHLLCKAMSILYDHALLGADEIRAATSASFPASDLDKQIERVRITLQPMSLEEISKLWSGLVTQYRLSVGYEVSVALIDSTQPKKTPLPVLTRGPGDKGVTSHASLIPPFPALDHVEFQNKQPAALLGDTLVLKGNHLDGINIGVQFNHPLWTGPVEIAPLAGGTATQVSVQIPNSPAAWPAGFYTVCVLVQNPIETYRRTTNQLSFGLAPKISVTPANASGPNISYTATCSPQIWADQRASLLLGDQEILADAHLAQTATLTFLAQNLSAAAYFVRLRVDGVDSLLVNQALTPPKFDSTQQVTVT